MVLKLLTYKIFVEIVINKNWKITTEEVFNRTKYWLTGANAEYKKDMRKLGCKRSGTGKMRNEIKLSAIRRDTVSRTNASH